MANKVRVSLTIGGEILDRIDKERGLIPRSAFIEVKLKKAIEPDGFPPIPEGVPV